jgi:hypothetical protein
MAIEIDMPVAPNNIRGRRPNFSMVKTATHDAIQYSVPFKADSRRLINGERPMEVSKIVAA